MSSQRNIATRWGKSIHTRVANLSSGTSKQQTSTERQRGRKREKKTQLVVVLFFLFMKELLQVEATVKSLRPELSSVSRGLHWNLLSSLENKLQMRGYSLRNSPYKRYLFYSHSVSLHMQQTWLTEGSEADCHVPLRERQLDHWTWHLDATQQLFLLRENKSRNCKLWTGNTTNQRIQGVPYHLNLKG